MSADVAELLVIMFGWLQPTPYNIGQPGGLWTMGIERTHNSNEVELPNLSLVDQTLALYSNFSHMLIQV